MVLGKLLTLLCISSVAHADISIPRFFEYQGGPYLGRILNLSFGWFKTLDAEETEAYHSSIMHAVMSAQDGERVVWYKGRASGMTIPVMSFPTGSGYCRRMHIQATAYNVTKTMAATTCYHAGTNDWRWITDK